MHPAPRILVSILRMKAVSRYWSGASMDLGILGNAIGMLWLPWL